MKNKFIAISVFIWIGMMSYSQQGNDMQGKHGKEGISGIVCGKIIIAAHRGGYENDFADKAPENSIANIQNAIDHSFEIYETDVQRTSDGVFIIMHDPTIDRTTTGSGKVAEMSSEEIKKYNLKYSNGEISDEKIPFLTDFISGGEGKIIFKIDYKPELKYLNDLIKEIERSGFKDWVILRFRYKKEIAEYIARLDQDKIPEMLFRVKNLKQYHELRSLLDIKMISIDQRKKFTDEQLKIIKEASEAGIIVEAHTFYAKDPKQQEMLWVEQVKLPITIWHTKKPGLFQEFLKKQEIYKSKN